MVLPFNVSDYFTTNLFEKPTICVCPRQFLTDKTAPLRKRVSNKLSNIFVPHHLVFYEIFWLVSEKIQKWPKTVFSQKLCRHPSYITLIRWRSLVRMKFGLFSKHIWSQSSVPGRGFGRLNLNNKMNWFH